MLDDDGEEVADDDSEELFCERLIIGNGGGDDLIDSERNVGVGIERGIKSPAVLEINEIRGRIFEEDFGGGRADLGLWFNFNFFVDNVTDFFLDNDGEDSDELFLLLSIVVDFDEDLSKVMLDNERRIDFETPPLLELEDFSIDDASESCLLFKSNSISDSRVII